MRRAVRAAAVALALAVAACGGGGDFSGDVSAPDGYTTFEGQGATFVRPAAFRAEDLADDPREFHTRWADPDAAGDYVPYVDFEVGRGEGGGFEARSRSLITVFQALGNAEVEARDVEVPGAEQARRIDVVAPPKPGGNQKTIRSSTLLVRRGEDLLQLSAGAPEDRAEQVDHDAVVESLRLEAAGT